MRLQTRKLLDRSFSAVGIAALILMAASLIAILAPIFSKGIGAYVFRATYAHRQQMIDLFERGDARAVATEVELARAAKQPIFDALSAYYEEQAEALEVAIVAAERLGERDDVTGRRIQRAVGRIRDMRDLEQRIDLLQRIADVLERATDPEIIMQRDRILAVTEEFKERVDAYRDMVQRLRALIGPLPGDEPRILARHQYAQARWDRALVKQHDLLMVSSWDYSDPSGVGKRVFTPRRDLFEHTALLPVFDHVENNLEEMLRPRWTFYGRFLTDTSVDAHFFGGIGPETLGTFYLTVGAMLFAVPLGIIAAIYFAEYAKPGRIVSLLRSCVSTLAGVPSIVFGLFGLSFFLIAMRVSPGKSVLAGSLTLGLLVLPTVIRASEEAILAVPRTYKEAAMALGAGQWRTVLTVILPAALPGILTGIVISMGRAAGETAPIIFTAAVSVGQGLRVWEVFTNPTPALSWNIYNLATEHEAVDEIRHVQFGMVTTLVAIVLVLNLAAIALRARISKRLRG